MDVMFVLAGLGAGGAERVVALVSAEMIRRGERVCVVSFDSPEDPVYHAFAPGVELVRLGIPAGGSSFFRGMVASWRRMRALRAAIRQRRPGAVISFLTKINVITGMAARGCGIPVFLSERNNPDRQRAHPLWALAWKWAARRAEAVVLQTEAIRALYPVDIARRAQVVPNPVETLAVERVAHDRPQLTAVGRLTGQKGFDLLIAAFAQIAPEFPEWDLTIWGEGPDRLKLQQQISDSGFANRIFLPGNSATPGGWIASADAFVLSSRFEGFPNVLIEAMHAGLPVVSFRCDFGPDEIVSDGIDGILVERESVPALVQALRVILSDKQLRESLGRAAFASAARFDLPEIVSKWETIVKNAFASKAESWFSLGMH